MTPTNNQPSKNPAEQVMWPYVMPMLQHKDLSSATEYAAPASQSRRPGLTAVMAPPGTDRSVASFRYCTEFLIPFFHHFFSFLHSCLIPCSKRL